MTDRTRAFTLIELLVVVAIIALLIGILVPSLAGARDKARASVCGTHIRSICQGMAVYATDYDTYPSAYFYKGQTLSNDIAAQNGYIHWSSFLFSGFTDDQAGAANNTNLVAVGKLPAKAFVCPAFDSGGLPPTNPGPKGAQLPAGFVAEYPGVTDEQAPLISYTVNEALCGRNKWFKGFTGEPGDPVDQTPYRFVRPAQIESTSGTILATEFTQNALIVSSDSGNASGTQYMKSHRPVHGFSTIGGGGAGVFGAADLSQALIGFKSAAAIAKIKPNDPATGANYTDLSNNNTDADTGGLLLARVGRNHGTGSFKSKKSNFGYVDGHVELKRVVDTLAPNFEWGARVYSLSGGDSVSN
jgi:prepilin-type N-terminal cleavage/methylation domain-containing protein/prepilin-type processing-associated H-X9-DG protein